MSAGHIVAVYISCYIIERILFRGILGHFSNHNGLSTRSEKTSAVRYLELDSQARLRSLQCPVLI